MLFLELKERAQTAPTAALGALDLLSKLVPQGLACARGEARADSVRHAVSEGVAC